MTTKVARGLLAAFRDFGILEGKSQKRLASFILPVESFAYLAFCLHREGVLGRKLVFHTDWDLFLLQTPAVEHYFLEAHQRQLVAYHAAGSTVNISFPCEKFGGLRVLSLSDRIRLLEADLIAIPHAFIMARELPFAIFRGTIHSFRKKMNGLCGAKSRSLQFESKTRRDEKLALVSLADLFWESIRESEALDVLIALELEHGFEAAQRQVNQYLSDPDFRPCPMLVNTASSKGRLAYVFDSCKRLCSWSLPCVVSPRTIRWAKLKIPAVLFYPGKWNHTLNYMGLRSEDQALGQLSCEDLVERFMTRIADLLKGDFRKPIEEIIKVNNTDEETVYTELTEYIATDRIKSEYERLLRAMADAPKTPTRVWVFWISGFFGSGKSSFARTSATYLRIGQYLANRLARYSSRRSGKRISANFVEFLNSSIPCEVFMFDVQVDLSVQTNAERIAEVMYRVLLRELDYAEDYDIAELEIELEREDKLDTFKDLCQRRYKDDWRRIRKGAQKFARTSAILHDLERGTYKSEDTWLQSVKARPVQRLTVKDIVDRCFDLCAKRRPGKSLHSSSDEMGQYVARSGENLENLRAVVEQFGRVSLDRLRKREIPGPAWIIVTAQEKLQEVYNYIASGRIDLPKLQDRFKYQIDLSPADIREVATKRVLSKKQEKEAVLLDIFKKMGPVLLQNCKLERTARRTDFSEDDFRSVLPVPATLYRPSD